MATQQYGYGPNVWAPAKGVGIQQFAKLAQPGAVTPQFKAENKYKALAAKAIGEMAYGAMMNSQAKKKKAEERALTQSLYGDTFEALSGKSGDFMFQPFESSVVPTAENKNEEETYVFDESTADKTKTYKTTIDGKPKEAYWYVPESNQYQNEDLGNLPAPYWAYKDYAEEVVQPNEGQTGSIYTIGGIQYQDGKPITQDTTDGTIYNIDGLKYKKASNGSLIPIK